MPFLLLINMKTMPLAATNKSRQGGIFIKKSSHKEKQFMRQYTPLSCDSL